MLCHIPGSGVCWGVYEFVKNRLTKSVYRPPLAAAAAATTGCDGATAAAAALLASHEPLSPLRAFSKRMLPYASPATQEVAVQSFAGLCGGVAAATATTPFDVIRVRMQSEAGQNLSMYETARKAGLRNLYRGYLVRTALLAPTTSVTLTLYEFVKKLSTSSIPPPSPAPGSL